MRTLLILALLATPALAQDAAAPSYQDDRSSGTAVIQSFYNAINRGELSRAWSYYQPADDATAETLAADFATFADGYADTKFVTILTGDEVSEGAAGSLYYTVPVAIDAENTDGSHQQFAGCYTLRLVQPANQESPPYRPLHIEKGELADASGELSTLLPQSCP